MRPAGRAIPTATCDTSMAWVSRGAQVIVVGRDEHLTLAGEAAERAAVVDPVEVALEARAVRIGRLGPGPVAGADRSGCADGQRGVLVRLPRRALDEAL